MKPRVLVTGANGFVGSALMARLVSDGYDTAGLIRSTSDLKRIDALETRDGISLRPLLRTGSLEDSKSLEPALADRTLVVHTAAKAADWGAKRSFIEANATGVKTLVDAMPGGIDGETPRLILVSTANVAGYGRRGIRETDPAPEPSFIYSSSKLAGERAATDRCRNRGISLQILRPGGIYGPGDWKWSYQMFRVIESGGWPLIDGGRGRFTPIYIENFVDGILATISRPETTGTFNLTDGASVTWLEFSTWIAEALGVPLRARNFPFWLAWPVAHLAEGFARLAGVKRAPGVTRYRVVRAAKDFDYSCELARKRLGYRPDPDIRSHIASTAAWYRTVTDR